MSNEAFTVVMCILVAIVCAALGYVGAQGHVRDGAIEAKAAHWELVSPDKPQSRFVWGPPTDAQNGDPTK